MNDTAAPDRIGRFSRTELEAMRGKRGRKPPEYFELFPELKKEAAAPAPRRASVKLSATASATACAEPGIAYAALGADPLAARLALAPAGARKLVEDLLDLLAISSAASAAAIPPQAESSVDAEEEGNVAAPAVPESESLRADPVYADPEADDAAIGLAG